MPRSYQRAGRAAAVAAGLLAAACTRSEVPLPSPPAPPAAPARILASASYEPIGRTADGLWIVANESAAGLRRAVRLRVDAPTPEPLPLAGDAPRSLALAMPRNGALIAVETRTDGQRPARELRLLDPTGRAVARLPLAPDDRVVGIAGDGSRLWIAASAEGGERLVERTLPSGLERPVAGLPRGFAVALVSDDGERVVLRRAVEAWREEVLLFERSGSAATLLLPLDRDGRFLPLALSPGGARLLVSAHEVDREPALLELDLTTLDVRRIPGPGCPPLDGSAFDAGGWLVRWRCADGVRIAPVDSGAELPEWPEPGAAWRSLVPLPDGEWIGAAAVPGAPSDLWLVPGAGERRPLTWGLAPRLDPRAVPRPEATELVVRGRRRSAERWPAEGQPAGAVLWIHSPGDAPAPLAFAPVPAALASGGIESLGFELSPEDDPEDSLDALVAAWETSAAPGSRAIVGAPGPAADAVVALARRRATPALIAVAPTGRTPASDAPSPPLSALLTLVVGRFADPARAGVDPADPRLTLLRVEPPPEPGSWPVELHELLLARPATVRREP